MKNNPNTKPLKEPSRKQLGVKIIAGLLFLEIFLQTVSFSRYVFWKVREYREKLGLINNHWFYHDDKNSWWLTESKLLQAEYHPLLSFVPKPLKTPHITINEQGIRKTTGNPATVTSQQIKIFIFGGSTVFGTNVTDDETIPSHIAKLLNANGPAHQITNFGASAYNSSQELTSLLIQLKQGNVPDMVIFYDGINDFYSRYLYTYTPTNRTMYEDIIRIKLGDIWRYHAQRSNQSLLDISYLAEGLRALAPRIKTVDYTVTLIRSLKGEPKNDALIKFNNNESLSEDVTRVYAENVTMVQNLSKIYGFKTLFIWQPSIATKKLTGDETEVMNSKTEPARLYKEITGKVNGLMLPDFYDASNIFSEEDSPVYLDFAHVSPEANKAIAEHILPRIIEKLNAP